MRIEHFKKLGELLVQVTDERPLQHNIGSDVNPRWSECYAGLNFNLPIEFYRLKPVAKVRAWRPEEVPLGAQFRDKRTMPHQCRTIALSADNLKIYFQECEWTFAETLENGEHSLDHGKTWLPCGVLETETT